MKEKILRLKKRRIIIAIIKIALVVNRSQPVFENPSAKDGGIKKDATICRDRFPWEWDSSVWGGKWFLENHFQKLMNLLTQLTSIFRDGCFQAELDVGIRCINQHAYSGLGWDCAVFHHLQEGLCENCQKHYPCWRLLTERKINTNELNQII